MAKVDQEGWININIRLRPEELSEYVRVLKENHVETHKSDDETVKWWIHEVIHDRICDLGYEDPYE